MGDNNQPKIELPTQQNSAFTKPSMLSVLTSKIKLNKLGNGKVAYFLGGFGISFGYLYFHFMSYISNIDESLKSDIDEIKKLIEKHNANNSLIANHKRLESNEINDKL